MSLLIVGYLFFSAKNIYYALLYLFLEIVLLGIVLGLLQMDFFTGFLWVIEFTVIFVAVLLLFYINVVGSSHSTFDTINVFSKLIVFIFTLGLANKFCLLSNLETLIPIFFNSGVI